MVDGSIGWRRRLRGAIGNALVWGAGWAAAGAVGFAALSVTGVIYAPTPWRSGLELALKLGLFGTISGAAFAAIIRLAYHGRRLSQIHWLRFGLTAGVATGIFVPLFMQGMNILSGDGMVPWGQVLDDGVVLSVFGAVAAAGSIKLAQRARQGGGEGLPPEDDGGALGADEPPGRLEEGSRAASPLASRARTTTR